MWHRFYALKDINAQVKQAVLLFYAIYVMFFQNKNKSLSDLSIYL